MNACRPKQYCKFGNFCEGFIFAKFRRCESFVKIKPTQNGEITFSFTDVGSLSDAQVANFKCEKMTFGATSENKILAKISVFTVDL